jgi:hypothetical protein
MAELEFRLQPGNSPQKNKHKKNQRSELVSHGEKPKTAKT